MLKHGFWGCVVVALLGCGQQPSTATPPAKSTDWFDPKNRPVAASEQFYKEFYINGLPYRYECAKYPPLLETAADRARLPKIKQVELYERVLSGGGTMWTGARITPTKIINPFRDSRKDSPYRDSLPDTWNYIISAVSIQELLAQPKLVIPNEPFEVEWNAFLASDEYFNNKDGYWGWTTQKNKQDPVFLTRMRVDFENGDSRTIYEESLEMPKILMCLRARVRYCDKSNDIRLGRTCYKPTAQEIQEAKEINAIALEQSLRANHQK